jgi:hypothetical protein
MLNQVTDYTILENSEQSVLIDHVTEHMRAGWVPSGPLVINGEALLQVMVKFSE